MGNTSSQGWIKCKDCNPRTRLSCWTCGGHCIVMSSNLTVRYEMLKKKKRDIEKAIYHCDQTDHCRVYNQKVTLEKTNAEIDRIFETYKNLTTYS